MHQNKGRSSLEKNKDTTHLLKNGHEALNSHVPASAHMHYAQMLINWNHPGECGRRTRNRSTTWSAFSTDTTRKTTILGMWEATLKCGGSWGICERALATFPRPARRGHHCLPHKCHYHPPHKGTVLKLSTVQFMNGLRPSIIWNVGQQVYSSYSS